MVVYLDAVVLLNVTVDFLLLVAAHRLCQDTFSYGRTLLAAILGGVYCGACLLPGFSFLGNWVWKCVSFLLISVLAFGHSVRSVFKSLIYFLLSMTLGGIAIGFHLKTVWMLLAAAGLLFLCRITARFKLCDGKYIPVELKWGEKCLKFTALKDTGNALTDPVTGHCVLVVGRDIATQLLGLTEAQLRTPAETFMNAGIQGLRLIPYHTVDQSAGLFLGMRIADVKIGDKRGSTLVAFAPNMLSENGVFQALTGG